jgi:hypothetical protein
LKISRTQKVRNTPIIARTGVTVAIMRANGTGLAISHDWMSDGQKQL